MVFAYFCFLIKKANRYSVEFLMKIYYDILRINVKKSPKFIKLFYFN